MKAKRNLLLGVTLGIAIGWAVGFLRLPFLERNDSFWIGFAACAAVIAFVVAILFAWNKNRLLVRLIGRHASTERSPSAATTYTLISILVAGFIVLGGLASGIMIYRQTGLLETQTEVQNKKVIELTEMVQSMRRGNQVLLMSNVLDKVDEELNASPDGMLSDATIARIVALSHSLKPYRYFVGDSLSEKQLSPERGQLLLALSLMKIDSVSFRRIRTEGNFLGADLSNSDLSGLDLSGIDLSDANLSDADLREADLGESILKRASLLAANLERADLTMTNLERANLSWTDMNGAKLHKTYLDGADLNSSRLRYADLTEASLRYADLTSVLFDRSRLSGANLFFADMKQASFSDADLSGADLRKTNLKQASLKGAELSGATVQEEDWLEKLDERGVVGAVEIRRNYKIVLDTSRSSKHRLERIPGRHPGPEVDADSIEL
jgi:uncharacterized protein YjbI with pentapeptide repeats